MSSQVFVRYRANDALRKIIFAHADHAKYYFIRRLNNATILMAERSSFIIRRCSHRRVRSPMPRPRTPRRDVQRQTRFIHSNRTSPSNFEERFAIVLPMNPRVHKRWVNTMHSIVILYFFLITIRRVTLITVILLLII